MDDDTSADQRLPHRQDPNVECDVAELKSLGKSHANINFRGHKLSQNKVQRYCSNR